MAADEIQQVGPYAILELLSSSSTSSFYLSKQKKKEVVVKRLQIPIAANEAKEVFLLRARQLKKIKGRSIVSIQDFGFDGDFGYLVLEHIKGESLTQHTTPGKISPGKVKQTLSPLAQALHYAHTSNVIHGNLYPGAILFNERNEPMLTNFSLSLPDFDLLLDDEAFAIPYMAPEQLSNQTTPASDQYALAVIAYELLCGRRPYEATERDLLLQQQQSTPLPSPRSLNEEISPVVEQVLLQALAYQPKERFTHTQDFSDAYLHALMGLPVKTTVGVAPKIAPVARPLQSAVSAVTSLATTTVAPMVAKQPKRQVVHESTPDELAPEREEQEQTPAIEIRKSDVLSVSAKNARFATSATPEVAAPTEPFPVPAPPSVSPPRPKIVQPMPPVETDFASYLHRTVVSDLRQGGVLSRQLPGYEERPAQVEMATMIASALTQDVPLIIEAGTGTGKALDVDTPIPTVTGWKRMGDLTIGDIVFDENGNPTRVKAAFDIMHERPCYEVEFSDGSSLIADAEHEWVSYTCTDRKWATLSQTEVYKAKKFVTTESLEKLDRLIHLAQDEDILSVHKATMLVGGHHWSIFQATRNLSGVNVNKRSVLSSRRALLIAARERFTKDPKEQHNSRAYTLVTTHQMAETLTVGSSKRANHAIAVARPLALPDVELPIAPYFLGFWLGDGSSNNSQITTADPEIIQEIERDGYTVRSLKHHYLYAVDDENGKAKSRWQPGMVGRLRTLNLLHNKHIPQIYLRSSEQQRRALLAGLLDTDGTGIRDGAVEFTTTNPQLAQDVYELVCSLGLRPAQRCGRARLKGKDCGPKWTTAFTTEQQVFRLPRKVIAQKEFLRNYNANRNRFRYVVAIREVPSRPVRCIQVEAQSHLYLAGRSMIPTHNSLAYLVPIVRSGKVAIVSTANKALQEQLFYKDIPFVQKHIQHFEAALVKGVSNYVCIDRMENERVGMQAFTKNSEFRRLLSMVNDYESDFTGDFETLGFQLPNDIRSRVATDSDQCAWTKCGFFSECFVRQMRERAEAAQVIVVNHTLLLLDAAIGGFLLPKRDVIVLDEAHHLEEEATRSFTITISEQSVQLLLAQKLLKTHSLLSLQAEADRALYNAWERLRLVADPGFKGRANLEEPLEEGLKLATAISDVTDSLRKQRPKDLPEKDEQLYDKLLKRAQNLADNIRTVFAVADTKKFVYYVERVANPGGGRGNTTRLQVSAAPLDITSWLQERLFDKCNVISTSATLATIGPNPVNPDDKGPNFAYFRRRIGLDPIERTDVLESILPLAFDYESNALLYLPRDLPEPVYGPGAENYMTAIARHMYRLVKASRGRAFLLFSSKRMLDHAYDLMSPHLDYPLLKQGDMTRLELTRRFREEEGAVLFGLKSFWEGVDIAGEALSLVVIDKLPFDPPDDPVHEARVAQMKAAGENWFGIYVLPQTVLRLKQGLGRLLRTREDRGVMAILDTRLHTKGYGKMVLNALPPAHRTSSIKDVEAFFAE